MRPICFFILAWITLAFPVVAQDPVSTVLRITGWPAAEKDRSGIGLSVFSKQYYSVSNWNLTGLSVDYSGGEGLTAALICRDGIPGFSWYHLYLSHSRKFKKVSGMVQLRFSVIDLKDRPSVLRIGGNISSSWQMSQNLLLRVTMYDLPGWIFPQEAVARGVPAMQFLLFHEPGRQLGLLTGFRISQSQLGPVTAGIRVKLFDQLGLATLMEVLPFGFSIGLNYQIKGYRIQGWLEQANGLGITPVIVVGR
ncbi:MAG: hypothetical protein WC699_07440 [Bacteroidales bacterium]|jgi:hypothetical protein